MKFSLAKKVHLHDAVDELEVHAMSIDLRNNTAHFVAGPEGAGPGPGSGNSRTFSNQKIPDYLKDALTKFISECFSEL